MNEASWVRLVSGDPPPVRKRPPKPPPFRYSCTACGPLTPGQPHKSWVCRLMNGGAIVGAEDEYVFDEQQWKWRRVGEMRREA